MKTTAAVAAAVLAGCAAPPPPPPMAPTTSAWQAGLRRLGALRDRAAVARTQRVALELTEPRTGRRLAARGAVALAPPVGLRMILLGPGGTTALDLWLDGDRYRLVVPTVDLHARGDLAGPPAARRGLPVDFLRFWLLRPAEGTLLYHAREAAHDRFVLRDGVAVVDLRAGDDGRLRARRTTWIDGAMADEETVEADALGCAPVRYHQRSTGLEVTVRCEGEVVAPPPPRALADPDGAP